ncbi:50S ribosomal protein L12, chloroplastic [Apostasia shenzhenica]|uniref:50S ribosomal protein L12, chloroplastic n=1 Tax=Apostasia shenzhenica TaxID=1088818 RepID=A0A2I0AVC3_9ASPA|nr:50S ribosomal protein L12, chloroplastic [Apostasia shenzhenica]
MILIHSKVASPLRHLQSMAALRSFSSASGAESHTNKLERIADELLSLNKIERHDYSILYRLKLGLDRWGSGGATVGPTSLSGTGSAADGGAAAAEAKDKTAFDVKLEKFDVAAKIKVIKEVRTFTDLGLKEAKEVVEKAPVVLKKGVTKEEAEQIVAKLKDVGAMAVME